MPSALVHDKKGRFRRVRHIDELKSAFTETIGVPADSDFEAVAYGKTEGWDSVAHMALVAAIESKFDIMLDTDDVISLSSFPEAKRILRNYSVEFD